MKIIKIITSTIIVSSLLTITLPSFAANKAVPKNQNTQQSYTKSKRTTAVQTKEFKVIGIQAWAEAKKNGFKFMPTMEATGVKDGTDTWGISIYGKNNKRVKNGAHMVGGVNMLVYNKIGGGVTPSNPIEIEGIFGLFYHKQLKPGWKIKSMTITGNYQWTRMKYKTMTNNISTRIRVIKPRTVTAPGKAMLKEIVLVGPSNGRWQDAFDVM